MARGRKPMVKSEVPSIATSAPVSEPVVKINDEEIKVSEITIEEESIIPENEVPVDVKNEEPINTPETPITVVETMETRLKKCASHFNQAYFEGVAKKGCDYKSFGDWQKAYAGLMLRAFNLRGKKVLDVGSAYGAIGFGLKQAGATVTCVDIAPQMAAARVFDVNHVTAAAQKMDMIKESVDFIHASYLLNSVEKIDLESMFSEFKRLLNKGGKILVIMNFGKDQEVSAFDYRHRKETVVAAANAVGLNEVDVNRTLRAADDGRYEFMSNYNWGIVCFE